MNSEYKVLYRKYRPKNFEEVVGQKYTIMMLKNAIINNKLSHAYIFTGPRGTGKTSTAKIFAKTINCEHSENGVPCETCDSCKNINRNADIIEIDAASNNGVDEIRELINNVKIAPSYSKYKVYIIDEVHMLSQSAFNALLLTLEEPPAHIVFILATTNIESVPITILSRCQRYDFKKIDDQDILEQLTSICEKENITITPDALQEITYLSDGGLRDALSILNQLSTSESSITLDSVLQNYGSVSLLQIKKIVDVFLNNDFGQLKTIFDQLSKESIDYKTFIKKMIDELYVTSMNRKQQNDSKQFMKLKKVIFELNDLINKININIDPFLLMFMIFVENLDDIDSTKEDIKLSEEKPKSEKTIESNGVELEEKNNELDKINQEYVRYLQELIPIRINNCFVEANKNNLKESKKQWDVFLTNNSLPNDVKSFIVDCDVVLASPVINIIVHSQESAVNLLNKNLELIEKNYKDVLGVSIKFAAISKEKWEIEKNAYLEKLKSGYHYEIKNEPVFTNSNQSDDFTNQDSVDSSSEADDILSIFNQDKLEIK